MAEPQPRTIHEGATTGDVEDEVKQQPKGAEDRKAAAALASLDAAGDDGANNNAVDREAMSKAMKNLGSGTVAKSAPGKKEVKKIKVDPADVTLLIDELDLTKPKATELLKAHDGDAMQAMRAFITVSL